MEDFILVVCQLNKLSCYCSTSIASFLNENVSSELNKTCLKIFPKFPNFEELLHGGLWLLATCKETSENDFLFFCMACASYLKAKCKGTQL